MAYVLMYNMKRTGLKTMFFPEFNVDANTLNMQSKACTAIPVHESTLQETLGMTCVKEGEGGDVLIP